MASKRITNTNGSQNSLLNTAKSDMPKMVISGLDVKQKVFVESVLNNIFQSYISRDNYLIRINSKNIDSILGRTASLLDEVKDDFTSSELEQIKNNIIQSVKLTLEDKVKNNDSLDIQELTNSIVQNISKIQENKLYELKTSLFDFININKNIQEQQLAADNTKAFDSVIKQVQLNTQENNTNIQEKIEEVIAEENNQSNNDNIDNETEKIEQVANDIINIINKFKKIFIQSEININNKILDISNKIDNVITKINNVITNSSKLIPTSKDKKNAKKKTAIQEYINKLILETSDKLDRILDSTADFATNAVKLLTEILNKSSNVLSKFWLKLLFAVIAPTFILIGGALYLLAEPLKEALKPILDFVDGMITKTIDFFTPVRDFLIDILQRIFNAIKPALVAFFNGLASEAEAVAIGLGEFVQSVLNVLKLFMDGIATGAEEVGKALVTLAISVVNVLSEFMQGLGTQAEAIGQGLGKFVTVVLETLRLFAEGFGTQAEAIGEAIGRVALGLVNLTHLIVQFCKECVGILVAITGIVRDFFEGFRSKAKAIGEMISQIWFHFFEGFNTKAEEIGEAMAELALVTAKLLTKFLKDLMMFDRAIKLNVVAPMKAFGRKLNALRVAAADKGTFHLFGFKINLFGWLANGMSEAEKLQARADQNKSMSDLLADEKFKYQEQFRKEDEAAALKELNDKIMQKNLQQLMDNIVVIEKTAALIKSLHQHFLGQEKTDEIINAIQAMKPQIESLENIQQENEKNSENVAAEQLKNEQKNIKDETNKKEKTNTTQTDIMNYLKTSFAKLLDELNKPIVVPLQTNTNNTNMAAIEDQ